MLRDQEAKEKYTYIDAQVDVYGTLDLDMSTVYGSAPVQQRGGM